MLKWLSLLFLVTSCTKTEQAVAPSPPLQVKKAPLVRKAQSGMTWYESGSPKTKEVYEDGLLVSGDYYTKENRLESSVRDKKGVRTRRDDFGDLLSLDTIEGGEMVLRVVPHQNGSPKEVIPYVGDVVEGERKTFSENGEPLSVEEWKGGLQDGVTIVFQNGEKYAEVPYVRGAKAGVEKRYRKGKTLIEEITWVDSLRQGPSYTYLGDSVKTDWYFEGRQVTKQQYERLLETKKVNLSSEK